MEGEMDFGLQLGGFFWRKKKEGRKITTLVTGL